MTDDGKFRKNNKHRTNGLMYSFYRLKFWRISKLNNFKENTIFSVKTLYHS